MNTQNVELVELTKLKEHARNYKSHPQDQIDHIVHSIKQHGVYKNIVVASDYTILAGHGVFKAAKIVGLDKLPVIKLNIDPNSTQAIKIITADNEISKLAESDDRALTELLKEISTDDSLLGTGFDEKMLANLVFVTRPASEIKNFDEAQEWVGMPDFERSPEPLKIIVQFETEENRSAFCSLLGIETPNKTRESIWYPHKEREALIKKTIVG